MSDESDLGAALAEVRAYLEHLGHLGVTDIALERATPRLGEGEGVAAPAAAPRGFGGGAQRTANGAAVERGGPTTGTTAPPAGVRSFQRGSAGTPPPEAAPTPTTAGDRFGPSTLGSYGSLLGAARSSGSGRSLVAEEPAPVSAPLRPPVSSPPASISSPPASSPLRVSSPPAGAPARPFEEELLPEDPVLEDPSQTNLLAGLTRAKPRLERTESRPFSEPPPADRAGALSELRARVGDCTLCSLCSDRSQLVFGVGNPAARTMIILDAPSDEEDASGDTFGGPAGDMLAKIIEKVLLLDRSGEVFLTHAVMCRPAGGRAPEPASVSTCSPFLQRQIDIVRPDLIVALGRMAAQAVMGSVVSLAKIRGHWYDYRGIPLMCTFDPAAVLLDAAKKRPVFEDMKLVRSRLEQLAISG